MFEGQVLDRYSVELQLARNHPAGLPVVRETGGRIPRHIDRHLLAADGTACVLLPDERIRPVRPIPNISQLDIIGLHGCGHVAGPSSGKTRRRVSEETLWRGIHGLLQAGTTLFVNVT